MTTSALTQQFLEWVAGARRSRADVLMTWPSSCPRLSIWEDALLAGLVRYDGLRGIVELTPSGQATIGLPTAPPARLAAE